MDWFLIGQFALGVVVVHLVFKFGVWNHLSLRYKRPKERWRWWRSKKEKPKN